MKGLLNRILSIMLSISLILTVFFSYSSSVYAADTKSLWDYLANFGDKATNAVAQWMCQFGVIWDSHDFEQWLKNYYIGKEYWDGDYIHVDDVNETVTIDKELLDLLKQALKKYLNENQTFYYGWSTDFDDIPYSKFGSLKAAYDTVKNVLDTAPSGTIKLSLSSGTLNGEFFVNIYIAAFDNLRDVGFVRAFSSSPMLTYNYSISTWEVLMPDVYCVHLTSHDSAIGSWEDFKNSAHVINGRYDSSYGVDGARMFTYFIPEDKRFNSIDDVSIGWMYIVTRARTTFRIFRSSDDLFDYSLDKRGIYVTSDFWDKETDDFTANFDEISDAIDRMDDILQRLLDLINDKTDESTIEDLLEQILEELRKGGGSGGGGSGGGSSGGGGSGGIDSDSLFGFLSGYLEAILDYLDGILQGIEALVWLQWDDDQEDDLLDIVDLWGLIKDNPETGSQEVADTLATSFSDVAVGMTKKFPFSIPWDLYALFTVFSETDTPKKAERNILSEPYTIGDGVQSMTIDGEDLQQDVHDAPYFKLPIKVESFGIYEEIIVDMKDFQTLSTLSRTLFSLIFAVYLIKLTIKIISLFRGGDGD